MCYNQFYVGRLFRNPFAQEAGHQARIYALAGGCAGGLCRLAGAAAGWRGGGEWDGGAAAG